MTIPQFLADTSLENSLLLGYYGGGNYGDELLLEVLQNMLATNEVRQATIAYQNPENFQQLHRDFGYERIDIRDKALLLRTTRKNKNIIVGGGGLWGLDMNLNTFLLSIYLFIARFFLRKNVYLLGVGYYRSTTKLGHLGAFLAGKAANRIFVRDGESMQNFKKINKRTEQDTDLAFYTSEVDLSVYAKDRRSLEKIIPVEGKTLFIAIRRFQTKHQNDFNEQVGACLAANKHRRVILALLELKTVDQSSHNQIQTWQEQFPNLKVLDTPFNPLALFTYFKKHRKNLAVIAPQFHLILTAHLSRVPFLPVVYDNKVSQLLTSIGVDRGDQLPIKQLTSTKIQNFIDNFFER